MNLSKETCGRPTTQFSANYIHRRKMLNYTTYLSRAALGGGGDGVRDNGKLATSLVTESDLIDPKVWSGDSRADGTKPLLQIIYRSKMN